MAETEDEDPGRKDPALRWLEGLRQTRDYDCRQCGACCVSAHHTRAGYVVLTPPEAATLQRLGLPVLTRPEGSLELGTVPFAGEGGGWICAAFQGTVGGACGCGVHEDRPATCRRLEVGSVVCLLARQEARLPL
jgi:Fe-S-cluster containining protein